MISKVIILVVLICAAVFAKVDVSIGVNLGVPAPVIISEPPPPVVIEEPPTVVVSPGVYVVPDSPDEIYFSAGFYWTVREGVWYRHAKNHQQWVRVEQERVPVAIVRVPRGRYKRWHPDRDDHDYGHHHGHGQD